ncbi:MAG: MarR family transcriptional regulator, partial [Bacteroidetes bacterium]|nr:MarR family transcriptional regulator [Bacteroidota bacterium]
KIAPRIGMEPNSLSRVLKTLIEKQWICKETNSKDKRVVLIRITEQGKAKREIALRSVFKIEKALLKDIHPDELAVFFKVMNTINLRLAEDME